MWHRQPPSLSIVPMTVPPIPQAVLGWQRSAGGETCRWEVREDGERRAIGQAAVEDLLTLRG